MNKQITFINVAILLWWEMLLTHGHNFFIIAMFYYGDGHDSLSDNNENAMKLNKFIMAPEYLTFLWP